MRHTTLSVALCIAAACGAPDSDAPNESVPRATAATEDPRPPPTPAEAPTTERERTEDRSTAEMPFQLEWRRASGAMFRDQLSLSSTGRLVWVGQVVRGNTGSMHAISLELEPSELRAVREAIDAADFFELPVQPAPSTTSDGTQLTLRIRVGERQHHVRLEEPLPAGAQGIHDAVDALLTEARHAQLAAAPEAQPEDFDPSLLLR